LPEEGAKVIFLKENKVPDYINVQTKQYLKEGLRNYRHKEKKKTTQVGWGSRGTSCKTSQQHPCQSFGGF